MNDFLVSLLVGGVAMVAVVVVLKVATRLLPPPRDEQRRTLWIVSVVMFAVFLTAGLIGVW